MKIEKAADGLRTVIAQGITVADTPCVLLLGMPLPRNLQADGAEDAFTRALSQMQDDLRRDYVTGVYNSVYLNEAFRPRAERAALDGKPVGVVMVRVNEYWQLREQESDSAADENLSWILALFTRKNQKSAHFSPICFFPTDNSYGKIIV